MTKTAIGITALVIHLIICILIWLGIRTGFLKVKMYMLSLAVFVPVWGPVCVLLIHFQLFFGTDQVKTVGVEKLRVNEEIYKNMFRVPVGQIILAVVWVCHMVYFLFGVKTIKKEDIEKQYPYVMQ